MPDAVTERPIIMSAESVRAILAGRKTQTRRIVNGNATRPNLLVKPYAPTGRVCDGEAVGLARGAWLEARYEGQATSASPFYMRCPYGAPGGRLWVRETWRYADGGHGPCVEYRAGAGPVLGIMRPNLFAAFPGPDTRWRPSIFMFPGPDTRWRPSIFMPRRASRLTLEVTGVRVERLQAITEEDARAEGAANVTAFSVGWDAIHARRAERQWSASPWVWVLAFRRLP